MSGRLGLREVRALQPGEEVWDSGVKGFGARRQRSEAVSYIVMFRSEDGRKRRFTIGRHGAPWTPDTARAEAQKLLGKVAAGEDPGENRRKEREAATVDELCDRYIDDAAQGRLLTRRRAPKKASTIVTDRSRIEQHIKPLLGRQRVEAITRDHVEQFMYDVAQGKTAKREKSGKVRGLSNVRGGQGTATRTVGLLGAIFEYAVRKRLRSNNPVRGVLRFADGHRERRINDAEYRKLGAGLQAASNSMWPPAVAATIFLALTGWRSGEAIGLTWSEVDLERRTATLGDTKTGRSVRPLSTTACGVLTSMSRAGELVFQPGRGAGVMSGFPSYFSRIRTLAGLPKDITPHVLRHSFASVASDLNYSESTIGGLIGHKGRSMTSRYVHTADPVLLAAADAVARRIESMMGGGM